MQRSSLVSTAAVVLGLVVLAGGVVWLRASDGVTYYAEAPEVYGMQEGVPLRFRGVDVGRVERIDFTDSSIRFTLRVTRSDFPIRAGMRLRPRPLGIFGDYAAELMGGDDPHAPLLAPGTVLGVTPPDTLSLAQRLAADSVRTLLRATFEAMRQRRESTHVSPPVRRP